MIWRLHWLEMRGGVLAALALTILAAALNFSFSFSAAELSEFVAQRGIFAAFLTALFAGGDGLHGPVTLSRHPWHLHKLALPIARRALVATRIAATAAAAALICTLVAAAYAGLAASRGISIDWPGAGVAHVYSVATAVAASAALAALGVVLTPLPLTLAALLVVGAALANIDYMWSALVEGRVAWLGLAGLAAVAAVGIAAAVVHAPRREVA